MNSIDLNMLMRRFALFLGILMSGGLFVFPRVPLLVVIAVLCFVLRPKSIGFRREMMPIAMFMMAVLILSGINDGFELEPLFTRLANFLGGVLLLGLYGGLPRDTLADDLFFILKWMCVQALATLVLSQFANGLFQNFEIRETNYRTILLIFTYHVMLEDSTRFLRPDGFFFEPGVFQMYLNVFLFIALFVKKSPRYALLGTMAVLAVQSTTGTLIAVAQIGYAFAQYLRRTNASQVLVAAVLGVLLIVPVAYVAYDNLVTKTTGVLRGSAWAREYDLRTGIAIVADNPLTGIGFSYERYYDEASRLGYFDTQLRTETITERPNSNGVVWLAVTVGIPLSILFLVAMFCQPFFNERWMFFAVLAISCTTEAILLTPFLLMFAFAGMMTYSRHGTETRAPQAVPTALYSSR